MAVLKQKRTESKMQFIETARQLEIFTLQTCVKFPKRYTFFITTEIVRLAQSIYNNVKSANSIFPAGELEIEMRKEFLIRANCDLQCLISQLDVAKEIINADIKDTAWCKWMDLIEEEAKLISSVKKNDKARLKEKS